MRTRTLFTTLILLCSLTLVAQQQREITLPEVTSGAFAARGAGNGFRSLPDGKHYTLISDDYQRIVKYEYATGQMCIRDSVRTMQQLNFKTHSSS